MAINPVNPIIRPKRIPFSTATPRSLPVVNNPTDTNSTFAKWNNQIATPLKTSVPATTPRNFSVTSKQGGLQLSWSPVHDSSLGSPDGYQILKSLDGSFTDDLVVIPVSGAANSSYFDPLGGSATSASYRIRTTSGTVGNPQSKWGAESGVVAHTSIAASDTATKPTTNFDNWTTDKTASTTRKGNYGFESYQTAQGLAGGSGVGSGAGSGNGSSSGGGGGSGSGASFSTIASGENTTASMLVGGDASITADQTDPGIISATALWSVGVDSTSTPAATQVLTFNGTSNLADWEYPTWAALTGDLTEDQVIPWDGGTPGTPDTGLSRSFAAEVSVGAGTHGDISGTLSATNIYLQRTGEIAWLNSSGRAGALDSGISRISAGVLAVGNGTQGDVSGTLRATIVNAGTGYQVAGSATSGNVLRGNGTNFVSATLAASDLSNGTTGIGAVALAGSPTFTTQITTPLTNLTTLQFTASGSAPTSAGTAGTAGQIIYFGTNLYICTVTGVAGAATWNKFNLIAV
jgi:hypothetical protein